MNLLIFSIYGLDSTDTVAKMVLVLNKHES